MQRNFISIIGMVDQNQDLDVLNKKVIENDAKKRGDD